MHLHQRSRTRHLAQRGARQLASNTWQAHSRTRCRHSRLLQRYLHDRHRLSKTDRSSSTEEGCTRSARPTSTAMGGPVLGSARRLPMPGKKGWRHSHERTRQPSALSRLSSLAVWRSSRLLLPARQQQHRACPRRLLHHHSSRHLATGAPAARRSEAGRPDQWRHRPRSSGCGQSRSPRRRHTLQTHGGHSKKQTRQLHSANLSTTAERLCPRLAAQARWSSSTSSARPRLSKAASGLFHHM